MMISSSKPRMQRLFRYTASMHQRQKFLHVHLDKSLRAKLPLKTRAVQVSRGDTVKIMSGSKRGTTGKVTKVNLRTGKLYIDSLKKKNARGKEFQIPVTSSNVYIIELNLTDKRRADKLKLKQQPKIKEQPQQKQQEEEAPTASAAPAPSTAQPSSFEKKAAMENMVK